MLTTFLAAVVVLGPVIIFHEFGHFLVAKLAGIYVKTFSVGFGPKLLKFRLGETQYALSVVPLGGYVKMAGDSVADEVEPAPETATAGTDATPGPAAAGEAGSPARRRAGEEYLHGGGGEISDASIPEHRYFRNKSIVTRLAVVTAGPVANFVLAVVVMSAVLYHEGMRVTPTTTLGDIAADSAEYADGLRNDDVVTAVAGQPVTNALELVEAVAKQSSDPFPMQLRRAGRDTTVTLSGVRREHGEIVFPAVLPRMDARIGLVKKDGPAWKAGLRTGDRIVEIDGHPVRYYDELADLINPAIGKELKVVWERNDVRQSATVVPESERVLVPGSVTETREIGRIQIEPYQLVLPVSVGMAAKEGVGRCWGFVHDTAVFLGALVEGKGNRDALGGPIRIAQAAGSAARWSSSVLLYFMAFFSVNLFLLNLLPIPVLDGGHVLFLLIEAVRGRALSPLTQERLLKVGVSALIVLMGYVVFNDLWRVLAR
jgi:regulator of sigma E protease